MEKTLSPSEAWADFYAWIKAPERWQALSDSERNRLITADRDSKGERKRTSGSAYGLGIERLESILGQFAPGRYTFTHHTTVTLNEET